MKKIVAVAMFLAVAMMANAQIYVGGSLGFESSKADKEADNLITWSVMPEIGFALNDAISFGLQGGFSSQELEEDEKAKSFVIAPYVRYTFAKSGLVRFFIDAGVTVTSINISNGYYYITGDYYDYYTGEVKGTNIGFGIRPGVRIAASDHVSLVAQLGYFGYSANSDDLGGGSSIGLGIDNTDISFGVFYSF